MLLVAAGCRISEGGSRWRSALLAAGDNAVVVAFRAALTDIGVAAEHASDLFLRAHIVTQGMHMAF